jgi:hypothetical protein
MSTAEIANPTGTAEETQEGGEDLRITEDGQIRIYENGVEEIVDR